MFLNIKKTFVVLSLLVLVVITSFLVPNQFDITPIAEASDCNVTFTTYTQPDGSWYNSGDSDRYSDRNRPQFVAEIHVTNCAKQFLDVWLEDTVSVGTCLLSLAFCNDDEFEESYWTILIPDDDTYARFTWILGDNECGIVTDNCDVRASAQRRGGIYQWTSDVVADYKCDGDCDTLHVPLTGSYTDEDGNATVLDSAVDLTQNLAALEDSPCYESGGTDATGAPLPGYLREDCVALLAPLPGFDYVESGDGSPLASWVNNIIRIAIAIAGLLAVIMIIFAGITYMTSNTVSGKSSGKDMIKNALIGLMIALGIFVILNTIDPTLIITDPDIAEVTLSIPEVAESFDNTEVSVSSSNGTYNLNGTYSNPSPSPNIASFVTGLSSSNTIASIIVSTPGPGSNNWGTVEFVDQAGNNSGQVSVRFGVNGVSAQAAAAVGDNKTPQGTYALTSDIRVSSSATNPVTTSNGVTNLGAAFWMIDIYQGSTLRGIGFHGHADNTLSSTNGCIRMLNDDLLVLSPYVSAGVTVTIN